MSRMSSLRDIPAIRKLDAERFVQGTVTVGYGADRQAVAELLNDALATETVSALRYRRDDFMAAGMHSILSLTRSADAPTMCGGTLMHWRNELSNLAAPRLCA